MQTASLTSALPCKHSRYDCSCRSCQIKHDIITVWQLTFIFSLSSQPTCQPCLCSTRHLSAQSTINWCQHPIITCQHSAQPTLAHTRQLPAQSTAKQQPINNYQPPFFFSLANPSVNQHPAICSQHTLQDLELRPDTYSCEPLIPVSANSTCQLC